MNKILSHTEDLGSETFLSDLQKQIKIIIEALSVRKVYQQGDQALEVLKGISLSVREGEAVAIVGPSGAGKSTFLNLLSGLDGVSEGSIVVGGEAIQKMTEDERARLRNRRMGLIFQSYYLLPELNALENVILPGLIQKKNKAKDLKERGKELLRQVGLEDRLSHWPQELSGGEEQRVAIARAMMNDPEILLCDEPTGNLDTQSGEIIRSLLIKLNREQRKTLVIVTHDPSIASIAHRVLRLVDGRWSEK